MDTEKDVKMSPQPANGTPTDDPNAVFKEGAIVWGKVRGFPWWPGMIVRERHSGEWKKGNKAWVMFFLEDQGAWLKIYPNELKAFDPKEMDLMLTGAKGKSGENCRLAALEAKKVFERDREYGGAISAIAMQQFPSTAQYLSKNANKAKLEDVAEEMEVESPEPDSKDLGSAKKLVTPDVKSASKSETGKPNRSASKSTSKNGTAAKAKKARVDKSPKDDEDDDQEDEEPEEGESEEEDEDDEYEQALKRGGKATGRKRARDGSTPRTSPAAAGQDNSKTIAALREENRKLKEHNRFLETKVKANNAIVDPNEGREFQLPTKEGELPEMGADDLKELSTKLEDRCQKFMDRLARMKKMKTQLQEYVNYRKRFEKIANECFSDETEIASLLCKVLQHRVTVAVLKEAKVAKPFKSICSDLRNNGAACHTLAREVLQEWRDIIAKEKSADAKGSPGEKDRSSPKEDEAMKDSGSEEGDRFKKTKQSDGDSASAVKKESSELDDEAQKAKQESNKAKLESVEKSARRKIVDSDDENGEEDVGAAAKPAKLPNGGPKSKEPAQEVADSESDLAPPTKKEIKKEVAANHVDTGRKAKVSKEKESEVARKDGKEKEVASGKSDLDYLGIENRWVLGLVKVFLGTEDDPVIPDYEPPTPEAAKSLCEGIYKAMEKVCTRKEDLQFKSMSLKNNLKRNVSLRSQLVRGDVSPEELVAMSPDQLKTQEQKREVEVMNQKLIRDAQGGSVQAASTNEFPCPKCKKREVSYYQMQTRSADEPMTTFFTCIACTHKWKD
eukprot:CAMPEP_0184692370 /NCGR_PEP_ID=MMETSP0313-20130426/881_1 /TAXON_ID=2792 /ORGANISM="Porphyridium aerugineum, Strain SAG 1380-2" /LENGTH=786 /DNA_ID=CAMNT_0027150197 /DNA_START=705 /DNA_END=3065 /DNA_ORIENTATION=-